VVLAVLAASSMSGSVASSQAVEPGRPGPAGVEPSRELALDGDAAAGAGAGKPLVAPSDPRARIAWLHDRVTAAIAAQPRLATAAIAVSVVDLATGAELVAHDAARPMSLASTAKLLTSSAALAVLGGGFRWRTSVHGAEPDARGAIAGPLYIKGGGDPMLGTAELRTLAADVAGRGVRSADRLVIDASYFDAAVEPPRFDEQQAETAGFRAPVASLGVARSAVTVIVVADPGGRATVTLDPDPGPEGGSVKLVHQGVTSVAHGRTKLRVDAKTKRDQIELEVSGEIRWGEGSWEIRKRVADPARFAGEIFRRALLERGVKIKARSIGSGAVPPAARLLAAHDSLPLTEVIRQMNKLSDNYLAECVLKTLGAETRTTPGPASWADGLAARDAAVARLGVPAGSYRSDNGSGLFDASAMSARQLTTLLRTSHQDFRIGPELVASLPVGGVDGTLARRWHSHVARGRVRAKTGTLDKVAALAGYVALDGQRGLGFAILVNDIPPGQRASARTAADDMVDAMIAYLAAPR
jgi:serine-type D-Ala-D-Ala carboxypeptidase/endopeptidase (penicillin-binding protein 4)